MTSAQIRRVRRDLDALLRNAKLIAFVVADAETVRPIAAALLHPQIEVRITPRYGEIASELFEVTSEWSARHEPIFVLDLRSSCGDATVKARSADYDAALRGHLASGHPWPKTICLVEAEQTRPEWLLAHPHLRATLLADEVETVIGTPRGAAWISAFQAALDCSLRE